MTEKSIPPRILIIDDDPMSRELLTALLEAEHCSVTSADSGEAAVGLTRDFRPDLVLTDLNMPGTTGDQLAQALRHACGPSTQLFAMSGTQPAPGVVEAYDNFLLKPFPIQRITDALSVRAKAFASDEKTNTEPNSQIPGPPASDSASKSDMQTQLSETPLADEDLIAPILNETIYSQLASCMPTPQLHEMYTLCVNDARERIALMRTLIPARDSVRFVREAHTIKGSCGMLGATQLHGMAAQLEDRGLDTSGSDLREVNSLDELSAACDRLERMLGSRV